jgi:hypothetical protein
VTPPTPVIVRALKIASSIALSVASTVAPNSASIRSLYVTSAGPEMPPARG